MAKRTKRTKWIALGALALAAFGAWAAWPRRKPITVHVARVVRVPELKAVVNGTGDIRTKDSVDIQAEIAGVIVDLPVREGDRVEKGQTILKIDPFQTESQVRASRAALSGLEAQLEGQKFQVATAEANAARDEFNLKAAEVELLQAQTNLARTRELHGRERKLFESNLISPDQFEVTETQLKLDEARVDYAKARVAQVQAQLRAAQANIDFARASLQAIAQQVEASRSDLARAEDLLGKTVIRSPIDGVIVKLNVEVGERAVPGIQSNPIATLMTIADLRVIEAELKVDETDIVNVVLGQTGRVLVDALPETALTGKVTEIGNSPIAGSGTGTQEGKDFKVVLRLEDPPESIRPGMSCEADITTAVRKDVLVVPIQALTARDVEVDSEGRYVPPQPPRADGVAPVAAAEPSGKIWKELQGVFLVGADRRAHFRPVKVGILGETDAEVLEGLAAGDEVVVGPLQALRTLEEHAEVSVDRTKVFRRSKRGPEPAGAP